MSDQDKLEYMKYLYDICAKYLEPNDSTLISLRDSIYKGRYKDSSYNFNGVTLRMFLILPMGSFIRDINQFLREKKINSLLH